MLTSDGRVVDSVRELLVNMTDQERVDLLHTLFDGYCRDCGRKDSDWRGCSCTNDE